MSAEQPPVPDFVADMLGQPVAPGDRIAYAATAGRSGNLVVGIVEEFRWSKPGEYSARDRELKIAVREEARAVKDRWGDPDKPTLIHDSLKRFVRLAVLG